MTTSDPTPAPSTPPPDRSGSGWTGGRVVALVFASLAGLVGIGLLLGGFALIGAHAFVRDDDGYYTSGDERLQTGSYAIITEEIDLGADPVDWAPEELLGTVRVRAESVGGRPVFLGIAPTADVDRYLRGVGYDVLTDFFDDSPRYMQHPGRAPRGPPGDQNIWVAETEGTGEQRIEWDAESGTWTIVVMNANAARGVAVDADVGVEIDWLIWAGIGLAAVGLVITATVVILILVVGRRASRDPATGT